MILNLNARIKEVSQVIDQLAKDFEKEKHQ